MLEGRKTYLVAAIGVIYAISGFLFGALDAQTALGIIWAAAGMAGLRSGIASLK